MNDSGGSGAPLDDLETTLAQVEQVPKVQKIERRFNRRGQVVVIVSLLVALASTAWNGWNTLQIAQNEGRNAAQEEQNKIQQEDIADLYEANRMREKAGLEPIPLPPEGDEVNVSDIAAAAAALALEDMREDPRFRGPQGVPGSSGQPGEGGDTGEAGQDGTEGPRGRDGEDGRSVSAFFIDNNGELWVEFTDDYPSMNLGRVVGPPGLPCLSSDPECKGDKGDPGTPGPACPPDWFPGKRIIATDQSLFETVIVCVTGTE